MQVGVAIIAAAVQRAGGSAAHPGTVLDEALELKAALMDGGAGPEASSLGQLQVHSLLTPSSVTCTLLPPAR